MLGMVLQASLFPCQLPGAHFPEAGRDGRWKQTVLSSECGCPSRSSSPAPPLKTLTVRVSGFWACLGTSPLFHIPPLVSGLPLRPLPSALLVYSTYLPLVSKETSFGAS